MSIKHTIILGLLGLNLSAYGREVEAPQNDISVTGLIEENIFTVTAKDISEFHANCMSSIRGVSDGVVDELFFSANNNRFVSAMSPSTYSDSQICTILEYEVGRSTFIPFSTLKVKGALEREPFQILAVNRGELLANCISSFTEVSQSSMDEMMVSLNGSPLKKLTTNSVWKSPASACKEMILNLDSQIR